jgi:hypothetical protein
MKRADRPGTAACLAIRHDGAFTFWGN